MDGYIWVLLIFFSLLHTASTEASVEVDEGDQYFGTPLGALHFSADGTSAEIYAADEFTVIFNHFYHNPKQAGCTAMMVGPARSEDHENVVEGHGLLLAPAHPPVAAAMHRMRRQAPEDELATRLEQFRTWPVEFDHLLMEPGARNEQKAPSAAVSPSAVRNEDNFEKITIHRVPTEPHREKEMEILGTSSAMGSAPNTSISSTQPSIVTHASTTATTTTTTTDKSSPSKPILLLGSKGTRFGRIETTPTVPEAEIDDASLGVVVTSSGETYAINHKPQSGAEKPESEVNPTVHISEAIRRAPTRIALQEFDQDEEPSNAEKWSHLESDKVPLPTSAPTLSTTPLFWVIKDPRESRRQRLLELRRIVGDPEVKTTTTTTTPQPINTRFEERFELPRIRDKLATFSLTNGAKINNYRWIGLYDQCLKRHIALVTLRDVDPPREEKIMPLSGWSHNVTSYRVHILNCNTILVPGFTYDGKNTTSNTYFFVGIGEFPNNIERQVKATVVGNKRDEPLREYNGEDVLLRLPKGYRTFDIDFISVYNTDEKKSFGHVIIPSLLVPPCSED